MVPVGAVELAVPCLGAPSLPRALVPVRPPHAPSLGCLAARARSWGSARRSRRDHTFPPRAPPAPTPQHPPSLGFAFARVRTWDGARLPGWGGAPCSRALYRRALPLRLVARTISPADSGWSSLARLCFAIPAHRLCAPLPVPLRSVARPRARGLVMLFVGAVGLALRSSGLRPSPTRPFLRLCGRACADLRWCPSPRWSCPSLPSALVPPPAGPFSRLRARARGLWMVIVGAFGFAFPLLPVTRPRARGHGMPLVGAVGFSIPAFGRRPSPTRPFPRLRGRVRADLGW